LLPLQSTSTICKVFAVLVLKPALKNIHVRKYNMLKRLALIALLIVSSSAVFAQYDHQRKERSPAGSRDGRFEGSVILAFQNGVDETSEGGSTLDIDSQVGWGFGVGWNWTTKWNLSYKLAVTKPDYEITIVPEDPANLPASFDHKMSKYSHQRVDKIGFQHHYRPAKYGLLVGSVVGVYLYLGLGNL
jgi:hypothetical protein